MQIISLGHADILATSPHAAARDRGIEADRVADREGAIWLASQLGLTREQVADSVGGLVGSVADLASACQRDAGVLAAARLRAAAGVPLRDLVSSPWLHSC